MWKAQFHRFQSGRLYEQVATSPGWVTKTALTAAAIVIVVPLAVLALAGVLVGAIVFVTLGLIARVVAIAGGLAGKMSAHGGQNTGRDNVRIIRSLIFAILMAFAAQTASAQDKPQYNAGNPRWNALGSPRETMFTFLENAGYLLKGQQPEKAQSRVIATLDRSKAGDQTVLESSEMLIGILDRLGEVKEADLPDQAGVQESGIRRFTYFPHGKKYNWVWDDLNHAPNGHIVLEADENNQWRFSADTVAGIPTLFESIKSLKPVFTPRDDGGGNIVGMVGPTFDKTHWWEWASLLIAIFIGLLAGKVVQFVCRGLAKRLDARQWAMRASVFNNLASPASLAMLTMAMFIGLGFIYMDGGLRAFSNQVIKFLAILSVGWYAYNLVDVVDLVLTRITDKTENRIDDMIVPLVRKTLRIFLVIVFTLLVAQNVFGLDITSWLAGLGIAGLAVSLAAQDSVKNLFGSITVFFDKPFLVDDFIVFDGFTGKVEEIGFRSTRLRLLSGHLVTIPNMKFIDGNVENISKRPYIRRQMDVTITYDTPPDKIEEAIHILRDILHDTTVVEMGRFNMEDNPPRVAFNELNADSLNIRAYYWYQIDNNPDRGFFTFMEHAQIVNMKLFSAYGKAGIDFAFPTQTLYIAGDPNRQLAVRLEGNSP